MTRHDFLEKYYPNYFSCDKVAMWNDMGKIICNCEPDPNLLTDLGYTQEDLDNNKIHLNHHELEFELLDAAFENMKAEHEIWNEAIDKAAGEFEGELDLISDQANAAFDSRNLVEGVDYEIGFSRSSILKLKIKE